MIVQSKEKRKKKKEKENNSSGSYPGRGPLKWSESSPKRIPFDHAPLDL